MSDTDFEFYITRNLIDGENDLEGIGKETVERPEKCTEKFRLLDDDNEVYFYGKSTDSNSEAAFIPLDEFGGSYGCVHIEYYRQESKRYEVL